MPRAVPPRPPVEGRGFPSILILQSADYKKQDTTTSDVLPTIILAEERADLVECKAELNFDRLEMENQVARGWFLFVRNVGK